MTATQWLGAYHATVWNNADPKGQNRVQLKIPQVLGTAVSHWAAPLALMQTPPTPGTKVIALFAGGDISHPLYIMQTEAGISLPLSIANGGTGQTTAAAALAALGGVPLTDLPLSLANGGTGQTSAQAAMNALGGSVTSGRYLRGNGTNIVMSAIQAADVPTLNQSTTGNAATATTLTPSLYTGSTSSQVGGWQLVCTANITSQFQDQHNTLLVQGQGSGPGASTMCLLNFRVKQQNAMGSPPGIELYSDLNVLAVPTNFMGILTANTTSVTTVQIWFQAPQNYENYYFYDLGASGGGATATYAPSGSNTWIATGSLPAGTQQLGVYGPSGTNVVLAGQSSVPAASAGNAVLYATSAGTPAAVLPSGYSGELSSASPADFTQYTVTSNSGYVQASKAWPIDAGDAKAGTTYRLTVTGSGTQGATVRALEFEALGGAAQATLGSGFAGVSSAFGFKVVLEVTVITTGSGGTCNISLIVSAGASGSTGGFASVGFTQGSAFNTTTANTLEVLGQWGNTGATFTSYQSVFERLGP